MNPDSNLSSDQFGISGNMGSSGMPSTAGAGTGGYGTSDSYGGSSYVNGGCASC